MSPQAMVMAGAFTGAVIGVNPIVLFLVISGRKSTVSPAAPTANAISNATAPPAISKPTPTEASPAAQPPLNSSTGKIRVKYSRDPKTHVRQIVLEDAPRPRASTVIYRSQRPAWGLISPNDEWVVMNERMSSDGSGERLFQRKAGGALQHQPAEETGNNPASLREKGAKAHLNASKTVATGWENDGHKLTLALTHRATAD
jgi:hypothetical protein